MHQGRRDRLSGTIIRCSQAEHVNRTVLHIVGVINLQVFLLSPPQARVSHLKKVVSNATTQSGLGTGLSIRICPVDEAAALSFAIRLTWLDLGRLIHPRPYRE